MSIVCILNGQQFFVSIIKNDKAPSTSGFVCFSNKKNNQIETFVSAAISNLYKKIFRGKTEYSGLLVLGFDDIKIVERLRSNITFFLIIIKLENLLIFITEIEYFSKDNFYNAGIGYVLTISTKVQGVHSLIKQTIIDNIYYLYIYKNRDLSQTIKGDLSDNI